jgi:hypothetical protein
MPGTAKRSAAGNGQPDGSTTASPTASGAATSICNGTDPTSGTELCAVAEYMYSLEEMVRMLGDPYYGDTH